MKDDKDTGSTPVYSTNYFLNSWGINGFDLLVSILKLQLEGRSSVHLAQ